MIELIPQIIQFKSVPENKYEKCETRKEFQERRSPISKIINKEDVEVSEFEKHISYKLDPSILEDSNEMLFNGDKIIGIYRNENGSLRICYYEWKENNPKEIIAYSLLKKYSVEEKIGSISFLKCKEDK